MAKPPLYYGEDQVESYLLALESFFRESHNLRAAISVGWLREDLIQQGSTRDMRENSLRSILGCRDDALDDTCTRNAELLSQIDILELEVRDLKEMLGDAHLRITQLESDDDAYSDPYDDVVARLEDERLNKR